MSVMLLGVEDGLNFLKDTNKEMFVVTLTVLNQ